MKQTTLIILIILSLGLLSAENSTPQKQFQYGFGATGIIQYAHGDELSKAESSMSYDFEASFHYTPYSIIYGQLQGGKGAGVDSYLGNWSAVNGDSHDDDYLTLTELWIENTWGIFAIKTGMISLGAEFDTNNAANSETEQFLNAAFINNYTLEFPEDNGLGLVLKLSPLPWINLFATAAEADADWQDSFQNGFFMGEIDFAIDLMGKPGNYRLYAWSNGTDREELDDPTSTRSANTGFGVSLDQEIPMDMTIFGRWGMADEKVSEIASSLSAGLSLTGNSWGREEDNLGLAYGVLVPSKYIDANNESIFEAYYNYKLNDHVNISPNIQIISNPGGDSVADPVFTTGIRWNFSF